MQTEASHAFLTCPEAEPMWEKFDRRSQAKIKGDHNQEVGSLFNHCFTNSARSGFLKKKKHPTLIQVTNLQLNEISKNRLANVVCITGVYFDV